MPRLSSTADYNFDARRFCASMILMTVPDPSASSFHELSPYIYCGANPIRNVDLTGRRFTEASMSFVNKLMAETNEMIDGFDKSILKKRTALNDESLSAKKRTKLLRGIEKLNNRKAMYQAVKDEIDVLASSTQLYNIRFDTSHNKAADIMSGQGGSINNTSVYDLATNVFEITVGNRHVGSIAHELKHAYQFETGSISFGEMGDYESLYDFTDEIEAYRRGVLFGQADESNDKKLYGHLKKSSFSVLNITDQSEEGLLDFAERNRCSFRWQGNTYTP
ncbi:MAG: hypothetical protein K2F97_10050, partial [Muribaculaceae bacterium]|nr:hypothetical protein [Muribaculaceae bacterium]